MLDAELLADVYINLTRGQDALLMAEEPEPSASAGAIAMPSLDLKSIKLPVLRANAQELEAHDDVIKQMDKSSGGKVAWRNFEIESANP